MSDIQTKQNLSPENAVNLAFWSVISPVMTLQFGSLLVFVLFADKEHSIGMKGMLWFFIAFFGGFFLGWLAWSILVPRWRLWAYERVQDISELKNYAVDAKIIWPEGHFFERTEIAPAKLRIRLRELELASKARKSNLAT
jgi:hypothetical protein